MNFIPYNKKSKKAQREQDLKHRNTWNINPKSRVVKSKKIYKRKRFRVNDYKEADQ